MSAYALPVTATLALWWLSTGVILYLDGRPMRTFVWSMSGATMLVGLALVGLARSRGLTTQSAAYEAFSCGLVIWGWQLVSFYMGYVTGPRKTALGADVVGWPRFVEAVRASLYHELAALLGGVLVFAMTWDQPNQIGAWTYVVLWWMHMSAKLNVFFGAPNLGEEMLPEHLRYLVSFMRRRSMNLFFPVSVTASTVITVLLAQKAFSATVTPFEATGYVMLTTMMVLAIAEHWFLVVPLRGNALWDWSGKVASVTAVAVDGSSNLSLVTAAVQVDGGYREPQGGAATVLESWSPEPPALCDESLLHRVLESIGTGDYGDVERVRGVVKTSASWVCFELEGRSASMAPFAPQRLQEPLVVAMGRRFDRVRLQAAFDACAAPI